MSPKIRNLISIVVLIAFVAACSPSKPATTVAPQSPTNAEKVHLVFWIQSAEPYIKAHTEIAKQYMAAHPNVTIEIQTFEWADFSTKISTSLLAGTGPDLMEAYSPWMSVAMRTGKIAEVPSDFMTKSEIEQNYYKSTLALLNVNGKYFGIPSNLDANEGRVLLVNKDVVSKAGVNFADNKNFEDWIKDWQALTVVENGNISQSGLGVACGDPLYQFVSYLMQFGGSVLTGDGKKAALNSDAGKKALQLMADLMFKYKIDSPDLTDQNCIAQGTAATSYRGTWPIPTFESDYPQFHWQFVLLPLPTGATTEKWHGGSGWATFIPSASKNQQVAWDYLKFTEANRKIWVEDTSEISAQKKLMAEMAVEKPDLYGVYYPILEQSEFGWPYGDFFTIYDMLAEAVNSVWLKQATVDQALATAEQKINAHLDTWWSQFK